MDKAREVEQAISKNWKAISGSIPDGVDQKRLVRIAVNAIRRKPDLANCSTSSIVAAIAQAAQVGIEPDDGTNRANLIRRGKTACFELQYRGVVDLAYRSGIVEYAKAQAVYEEDELIVDLGTANEVTHVPALGGDRGELVGAYSIIYLRGSKHPLIEVVDDRDIDKARTLAKSSPAWRDWPEEMARKFVLKRNFKQAPCSAEFRSALAFDDVATTGRNVPIDEVFPDLDVEAQKAAKAWSAPVEEESEERMREPGEEG